MAHPSGLYPPVYHLSIQAPNSAYASQLQEPQDGPYHMTASRSRSSHYNVPSPSTSRISNSNAPAPRSFDSSSFTQPDFLPHEPQIDPRLDELSFGGHSGRVSPSTFAQNTEPWNPHNLRNSSMQHLSPHPASYKRISTGPGSVGNHSAPRSDSGYQSQSALSNEYVVYDAESQQTAMSRVNSQHKNSIMLIESPSQAQIPSDQSSQVSSHSGTHDKGLVCPECKMVCKCKSDFKKHMLRHSKPHICEIPHCKRARKGFSTINDLDRHKKSVHGVAGRFDKSYRCASVSCRNKQKIWPRLDNFKQHIERMHKGEDHVGLINLSLYEPPPVSDNQQNEGIDPRELDCVGSTFSNEIGSFPDSTWPTIISQVELSSEPQSVAVAYPPLVAFGPSNASKAFNNMNDLSNRTEFSSLPNKRQRTMSQPKTSTAPQTKAQQSEAMRQSKALGKLSDAIAIQRVDSPSTGFDLEDSIRRILSTQNSDIGLTKTDAIKAAQAISNLIKRSPGSSYQHSRRSTQNGFVSDPKVCDFCNHAVARDCDLRKHMKRHLKPYGCTYPKCHKRFGAKSDWKRHENSQHFQLEAYRCRDCGEHCLRADKFETHMKSKHNMIDSAQLEEEKKMRKIGKNCQGQFWCGFCKDVIVLKQRRNAAWDERFDHIGAHFQEKMKIDDWVCAEENKKKAELLRDVDRYVFGDEDDKSEDAVGETDEMSASAAPSQSAQNEGYTPQPSGAALKRKQSAEPSSPVRRKRRRHGTQPHGSTDVVWYCCSCGNGPCGPTQVSCVECSHPWDSCCRSEVY